MCVCRFTFNQHRRVDRDLPILSHNNSSSTNLIFSLIDRIHSFNVILFRFSVLVNASLTKHNAEISHLNMAGDAEQTDSSGKYTFGGGGSVAKKYWPTILKSIELVSFVLVLIVFYYIDLLCAPAISQTWHDKQWAEMRLRNRMYTSIMYGIMDRR